MDAKNNTRDAKKGNAGDKEVQDNSTMVADSFSGVFYRTTWVGGEADINLIPPSLYEELLENRENMKVREQDTSSKFGLVAAYLHVLCDQEVTVDVQLDIRHDKTLMKRNMRWIESTNIMTKPLLGRLIQEAFALDTTKMLEAACDRYRGQVDVAVVLKGEEHGAGSIGRIITSGLFNSDPTVRDEDSIILESHRIDLREDEEGELKAAFRNMLTEAELDEGSTQVCNELSMD